MNKILGFFVLLVVVVGMMPFTMAADNGRNGSEDTVMGNDNMPEPTLYGNERPENAPRPQLIAARERMQNVAENAQQRMEQARENYQAAQEHYQQAREKYQEARGNVQQARERIGECKEDDSAECDALHKQVKENAKPFLHNSGEMIITSLEKLAARVEESNMDEERKAEMLTDIETRITEILEAQESADDLADDADTEDVSEATKKMKNAWERTKHSMQVQNGKMANEKLKNVYEQLDKLGNRLENAIGNLEEKGYDVSEAAALMDAYDERIVAAQQQYQFARQAYADALEADNVSEAVQNANQYVRGAHAELTEARNMLREIVRSIKGIAGNLDEVAAASDDDSNDAAENDGNETEHDEEVVA